MNLVSELQSKKAADKVDALRAYGEILERSIAGASAPEDAGILAEILPTLSRGEAELVRDVAALKSLRQAEANLAGTGTTEKIKATIAAAHAKAKSAFEAAEAAKQAYFAANREFNNASFQQIQNENFSAAVRDARAKCDFLDA